MRTAKTYVISSSEWERERERRHYFLITRVCLGRNGKKRHIAMNRGSLKKSRRFSQILPGWLQRMEARFSPSSLTHSTLSAEERQQREWLYFNEAAPINCQTWPHFPQWKLKISGFQRRVWSICFQRPFPLLIDRRVKTRINDQKIGRRDGRWGWWLGVLRRRIRHVRSQIIAKSIFQ